MVEESVSGTTGPKGRSRDMTEEDVERLEAIRRRLDDELPLGYAENNYEYINPSTARFLIRLIDEAMAREDRK